MTDESDRLLPRVVRLLHLLAELGPAGARLTAIAERAGLPRPSVHRLLRAMTAEKLVSFDAATKRYVLGIDLFLLAAKAGNPLGLRDLCRAVLLRLTASLGETSGADEASLRAELAGVTRTGYCDGAKGLIPGMTGLGVPILDQDGCAVAALSVGSTIDRLTGERSAVIASLLKREAAAISARLNPFDPVLRRPAAAMENLASP